MAWAGRQAFRGKMRGVAAFCRLSGRCRLRRSGCLSIDGFAAAAPVLLVNAYLLLQVGKGERTRRVQSGVARCGGVAPFRRLSGRCRHGRSILYSHDGFATVAPVLLVNALVHAQVAFVKGTGRVQRGLTRCGSCCMRRCSGQCPPGRSILYSHDGFDAVAPVLLVNALVRVQVAFCQRHGSRAVGRGTV
jgi:hypothetical protein